MFHLLAFLKYLLLFAAAPSCPFLPYILLRTKLYQRCEKMQILEIKRVKVWKSKIHLRNQTRQTLEIKIAIREIEREKFKIKMTQ